MNDRGTITKEIFTGQGKRVIELDAIAGWRGTQLFIAGLNPRIAGTGVRLRQAAPEVFILSNDLNHPGHFDLVSANGRFSVRTTFQPLPGAGGRVGEPTASSTGNDWLAAERKKRADERFEAGIDWARRWKERIDDDHAREVYGSH